MDRKRWTPSLLAGAAALAAAGIACFGLSGQLEAQEPDRDAVRPGPRVSIITEGVFGSLHPRAIVELSEPAHLAVFEVEPGVGAVMLYPHASGRSERVKEGRPTVSLSGVRTSNVRATFHAHLGHRLRFRSGHHPEAYLVAVASDRPLRLSGLLSGRVYAYEQQGSFAVDASVGETVAGLLNDVVAGVETSGWHYDLHAYSKHRSPGLSTFFGLGALGDLTAFNCLRTTHLAIALSPVSPLACDGFAFTLGRFAFGHPGRAPHFFFPHGGLFPEEDAADADPGVLDPTGITVGEPTPVPPEFEKESGTAAEAKSAAAGALLERIADARTDGTVTVEEVRAAVREEGLDLPRSLPAVLMVETLRRAPAWERARRDRGHRFDRHGPFGFDRGFSFPPGVRRAGDRAAPDARRPAPPHRVERPDVRRPSRPSVDRPSSPRRSGSERPRKESDEGGS